MAGGFKVGIVGGGMTGLIAALTLDRVGIDFILLEAYPEVNPDVGASIALFPNYQRVLDQLGVLDDVCNDSSEMHVLTCRNIEGKPVFEHHVTEALHKATGGYGIRTFTRSQLLKILYNNLSEEGKTKVHGSQRVGRIEELSGDEGVRLHMDKGHSYDVDLVIGADGTHSTVRSEMWRLAMEKDPKAFAGDQREDIVNEYGAVFGLSHKTGDLRPDWAYQITGQDMTIGLFGGPKDEALWFLFFKITDENSPGRKSPTEIPTWTKEQGAQISSQFFDAKLTDNTTFKDLYDNSYRITTHACPMHCLKRWAAGRLICLGDAIGKANPILAQGGAQGAESVLMLVDNLNEALQEKAKKTNTKASDSGDESAGVRLSDAEVEKLLGDVSKVRQPRVRGFIEGSQNLIRISAWAGWLFRFMGKYIMPILPRRVIVAQALGPWKGAYLAKSLPAPTHQKK